MEKERRIAWLEEQLASVKAKLRYQERTAQEGFFGSSTPSSKVPVKPNSLPDRQARRGGAKKGHAGHGRKAIRASEADQVQRVSVAERCPRCGSLLEDCGTRSRTVVEAQPLKVQKIVYRLERKRCPRCRRVLRARAPGVLAKCLLGNGVLTYAAVQHYVHGATLGQVSQQTGVNQGTLIGALHRLAERLHEVPPRLAHQYRQAPVKHADETGWRTDGQNGYAWEFCTPALSVMSLRPTRAAKVVREVLGDRPLPGVLVVDRYNAYNKAPCPLQYCYVHLLRHVRDLEKNFPQDPEVQQFVQSLAPRLKEAIELRSLPLTRRQFRSRAARLKKKIQSLVNSPAHHPAVQSVQDIFRQFPHRLYHWAKDRRIPADNNFAERELRPLVIARKISLGSQSQKGAKTRETLMTVLRTLRKRTSDVATAFKAVLDKLAQNPRRHPFPLLFPSDTS